MIQPVRKGAELVADDAPVLGDEPGIPVTQALEELGGPLDVGEDEGDGAAGQRGAHAVRRSSRLPSAGSSRSRRFTRGFASLTISSRYTT